MSEIRSIITRATSKSLVLIDEICRGTETAKGTCIAGSIIETLDAISCLGIVSTHLHGIFDLPLRRKNAVFKAMGSELVDNKTMPTWKLIDGICRESLAFETAQREGVPEELIRRAEELYSSVYAKDSSRTTDESKLKNCTSRTAVRKSNTVTDRQIRPETQLSSTFQSDEISHKEIENAVISICQKRLTDFYKKIDDLEPSAMRFVQIGAKEQPPPSTIGASSVYIMLRPDRKLYVGEVIFVNFLIYDICFSLPMQCEVTFCLNFDFQTDDLQGRIRAHRTKEGMQKASFLYFLVPGKSMACQLETLLINQLPNRGFHLTNLADGKHRNFGTSDILETEMVAR